MKEKILNPYPSREVLTFVVLLIIAVVSSPLVSTGIDWSLNLRPATQAFIKLQNPYKMPGTFNPPWLFLLLSPLAVLPERVGGVILFWMAIATWVFVSRKLAEGNLLSTLAVVTSPMVVNGLLARNVDFLVMWAFLLPAELAVFFLALKPQVGGAVLVLMVWQLFKEGGWRKLTRVFTAPILLTLISFIAYGPWPLSSQDAVNLSWNASPLDVLGWPSIVIGLGLLAFAFTRKENEEGERVAMAASPFFSPYVGSQSWVAILPALIKTKALYVVWIVLWGWIAYILIR